MSQMSFSEKLVGITAVGLLAVTVAGCGVAQEPALDEVELAEITALLDNGESGCGEAAADKTYNRVFPTHPGFTSPSNYINGKNGCGAAYFVDVTDYRTNNSTKTNVLTYGGTMPSTRAACEALNIRVYVFDIDDPNDAEYVDWDIKSGTWTDIYEDGEIVGGICNAPILFIENQKSGQPFNFNLQTGHDYKFAISARDIAPHPDVVKPIKISSRPFHQGQ